MYLLFTLYSPSLFSIFLTFDYVPFPTVPFHSLCTVHSLPCLISLYSSPSNVLFSFPCSVSISFCLAFLRILFHISHSLQFPVLSLCVPFIYYSVMFFPSLPIFSQSPYFSLITHLFNKYILTNTIRFSTQYHILFSVQHHPNFHPAHQLPSLSNTSCPLSSIIQFLV